MSCLIKCSKKFSVAYRPLPKKMHNYKITSYMSFLKIYYYIYLPMVGLLNSDKHLPNWAQVHSNHVHTSQVPTVTWGFLSQDVWYLRQVLHFVIYSLLWHTVNPCKKYFFLLIKVYWQQLVRLHRLRVYNSVICHLYITLFVHYPESKI